MALCALRGVIHTAWCSFANLLFLTRNRRIIKDGVDFNQIDKEWHWYSFSLSLDLSLCIHFSFSPSVSRCIFLLYLCEFTYLSLHLFSCIFLYVATYRLFISLTIYLSHTRFSLVPLCLISLSPALISGAPSLLLILCGWTENGRDNFLILQAFIAAGVYHLFPSADHLPTWNTKGLFYALLLHTTVSESLFYISHRLLHTGILFHHYHSLHHSVPVPQSYTGSLLFIYFSLS